LIQDKKVCECYGHKMGDWVATHVRSYVPGFSRGGFNSEKTVPDPFGHILNNRSFQEHTRAEFENCVMVEERGWGK
jgi:hypothetical protein